MLKFFKNSFIKFLIFIFVIKSTIASCTSSRANSDSDCYLNHLARENIIRMGMEGGCESPKQQIVYPHDSAKMYMPRGTLLYRCNDMSGCCPQKDYSCQPMAEEELRVAFYAIDCQTMDKRPTAEYVMLKNHTKCGCRQKMEENQGMDSSGGMTSAQRLFDSVCGQGRQSGGHKQQMPSYAMQSSDRSPYGQSTYGQSSYGQSSYGQSHNGQSPYSQSSYGQSSYDLQGSSYGQPPSRMSQSMPCSKNPQSTRPLIDGMVVRGTIQLNVAPKGQQPCPYG